MLLFPWPLMRRGIFLVALLAPCSARAAPPLLEARVPLTGAPLCLQAIPNGSRVLISYADRVELRERSSGKLLHSLRAPGLRSSRFYAGGQGVFLDTEQGFALWHPDSSARPIRVPLVCSAAGISPDGSLVVACQGDQLKAFDDRGKIVESLPGGSSKYDRIEIGADGLNLALCGPESFYLYDLPARICFAENGGHVAFHPDGLSIVRQSPTGWMVDIHLENGSGLAKPVETHTSGGVEVSADGQWILSQGQSDGRGLAQIWSFPRLERVSSRVVSLQARSQLCFDSRTVLSWNPGGTAELWDARTGSVLLQLEPSGVSLAGAVAGRQWLAEIGVCLGRPYYWSYSAPKTSLRERLSSAPEMRKL
jgi:hypothetical protein